LTPEFINYQNAQFLMVGEATDDLGKAATAEPDGKRSEEKQPGEELEQLEDENKERVDSLKGKAHRCQTGVVINIRQGMMLYMKIWDWMHKSTLKCPRPGMTSS
jgi:hypothetical protein